MTDPADRFKDKARASLHDTSPEYEAILRSQNLGHKTSEQRIKDRMRAGFHDTSPEYEAIIRGQKQEARSVEANTGSTMSAEQVERQGRFHGRLLLSAFLLSLVFTTLYTLGLKSLSEWSIYIGFPIFFVYMLWENEKASR